MLTHGGSVSTLSRPGHSSRSATYKSCGAGGFACQRTFSAAYLKIAMTEFPPLEVISASLAQAPILANLLELYAHDFSEFYDVQLGEDGRFGYPALPLYWSEPDRYPLLFKMDGKWAGLALVQKGAGCWDMAEFFVIRGVRRRRIGTRAAHEVWKLFPGRWQIRVMQANISAQNFWAGAIESFVGVPILPVHFEKGGVSWSRFSFNCGS